MIDSFVVYSPARTGSTLITKTLNNYFKVTVYHTHNPLFKPANPATSVAVISKRKDLFKMMISKLTLEHTKEYFEYDQNRTVLPFTISENDFTNFYIFFKSFYHLIDTDKFSDVKEVYFEDMLNDPKYLLSLFDINGRVSLDAGQQAPYVYSEIVLNLEQCRDWFNQLEQTSITTDVIDVVRRDIEKVKDINLWTGVIE